MNDENRSKLKKDVSFRMFSDTLEEVSKFAKPPRYENVSHYIRCAIMKLNKEEKERENKIRLKGAYDIDDFEF